MSHAIHVYLAIAAALLVATVAVQDYLYAPLRTETISSGLTGPYHWYLDASYLVLAVALWLAFTGHRFSEFAAMVAGTALILTAVTNTFGTWVDSFTGGQHALWHSRFTALVFAAALVLEGSANEDSVPLWCLTATNIAAPALMHFLADRADLIEKVAVLVICVWLIAWALGGA